jgi:hypothetical protein
MAESKIRRMPLPLSLNNPLHTKALKIIEEIPKGKRTEFICKKICAGENEELSPALRKAIYECVKQAVRDQGLAPAAQPQGITDEAEKDKGQSKESDEIRKNLFCFMNSLMNEHKK